jgi:hypothetical protein
LHDALLHPYGRTTPKERNYTEKPTCINGCAPMKLGIQLASNPRCKIRSLQCGACLREYGKSPSLPQAAVDAHALLVTTTTAMQLCEHGGSTDRRCMFGWTVPTPSIIAIRGQHGGSGELSRRSDCHWLRGRSSARQCAVAVPHHARQ